MNKRYMQLLTVFVFFTVPILSTGLLYTNYKRHSDKRFQESYVLVRDTLSSNPSYAVYEDGYLGIEKSRGRLVISLMKESFERNPQWITRHNATIAKLPACLRSMLYAIKSNRRAVDIIVYHPKYYEMDQLKACVKALDIAPDVDVRFSILRRQASHDFLISFIKSSNR